MTSSAQGYYVQLVILIISIMMVIFLCLLAAISTKQLTSRNPVLVILNPAMNHHYSFDSFRMFFNIVLESFFSNFFASFGLSVLSTSRGYSLSNFWVIAVSLSSLAILALFTEATKTHKAQLLLIKITSGLGLTLVGTTWARANFSIHSRLQNKTPLGRDCSFVVTQRERAKGVKDNTIWAFIKQLFSLRDRSIIPQVVFKVQY